MKQVFKEGYECEAVFYPEEEVWCSPDFDGYEWNTEEEMRKDMLVHMLCQEFDYLNKVHFSECESEEDVRSLFRDIHNQISKE